MEDHTHGQSKRCNLSLGVVLALVAGCTSADSFNFLLLQSSATKGDRVVAGSVDAVSQSLQASLTQLGLAVEVKKKGDDVYISSRTATGNRFTFVLTKSKVKDGEQTRVHIDWENGRDEEMGMQMLTQLELHTKQGAH